MNETRFQKLKQAANDNIQKHVESCKLCKAGVCLYVKGYVDALVFVGEDLKGDRYQTETPESSTFT